MASRRGVPADSVPIFWGLVRQALSLARETPIVSQLAWRGLHAPGRLVILSLKAQTDEARFSEKKFLLRKQCLVLLSFVTFGTLATVRAKSRPCSRIPDYDHFSASVLLNVSHEVYMFQKPKHYAWLLSWY